MIWFAFQYSVISLFLWSFNTSIFLPILHEFYANSAPYLYHNCLSPTCIQLIIIYFLPLSGIFVACYATIYPASPVRWSVGLSHFFLVSGLWPHCSCPSDQVTSNTASAHPHTTWVAVYLALFSFSQVNREMQNRFEIGAEFATSGFDSDVIDRFPGPRLMLSILDIWYGTMGTWHERNKSEQHFCTIEG